MWTRFMDMHSGGKLKLKPHQYILMEAPQEEAEVIFQNRFGRNPYRVTCTCCGEDYSVGEHETLAEATAYDRNCRWDPTTQRYFEEGDPERTYGKYKPLEEYLKQPDVMVIRSEEIQPSERIGELRKEGYVWQ